MMYALGINQSIERMCVTDNRHFIIGHYFHLRSPMGKLWVGEKYRDARIKHRKEGLFSFSFKTTSSICTSNKKQKKKTHTRHYVEYCGNACVHASHDTMQNNVRLFANIYA